MDSKIGLGFISFMLILLVDCRDILEDNISKKDLNLLSPGDGGVINNDSVSFWWDHLKGSKN
ncbi:MAG: hypothetical protein ABJN36_05975 [Cyclobacteriaceae bacterium]